MKDAHQVITLNLFYHVCSDFQKESNAISEKLGIEIMKMGRTLDLLELQKQFEC